MSNKWCGRCEFPPAKVLFSSVVHVYDPQTAGQGSIPHECQLSYFKNTLYTPGLFNIPGKVPVIKRPFSKW